MMNVLLIEDETAAAGQMKQLMGRLAPDMRVVAVLESIREAVTWLAANPAPDLIITDIQLADGDCFEIFRLVKITAPVIFTTAYDEFMQQAFKVNSVDYLLKPIDPVELAAALQKYRDLYTRNVAPSPGGLQHLLDGVLANRRYKSRFLVRRAARLSVVPVTDIAYLNAEGRLVMLHTLAGEKYLVDEALDQLEQVLDPLVFFRLNRKYIVPLTAIERIQPDLNGKLWIRIRDCADEQVFVSREKAGAFKAWLDA